MRKLTEADVTFTLEVRQDELPLEGNVLASGDDAEDRRAEEEIRARLECGDVWAWACVRVIATLTLPDGTEIKGYEPLGGCSYDNEEDFKQPGGYYDDMKAEALAHLQRECEEHIALGETLTKMFPQNDYTSDTLTLTDGTQHKGTLRYDKNGKAILDICTCGTCGFKWNDALITSITPTPSARCPNEYNHRCDGEQHIHCTACGITLEKANAGAFDCPNTNDYEHNFPGHKKVTTLT